MPQIVDYTQLSDNELLARFKRSSLKSGERLLIYPEIKNRKLLTHLKGKNHLLFRGTAPSGCPAWPEGMLFLVGCLGLGLILVSQPVTQLSAWILVAVVILPMLNLFHLILYRVLWVYPERISTATCLFSDIFPLKTRSVYFDQSGIYINAHTYNNIDKTMTNSLGLQSGFLYIWQVPKTNNAIKCVLAHKILLELLAQITYFADRKGLNLLIDHNFETISRALVLPVDHQKALVDLRIFCKNLQHNLTTINSSSDDANWLRLIAVLGGGSKTPTLQNLPWPAIPWLKPDEQLVLILTVFNRFLKKACLCFSSRRLVLTTLKGEFIKESPYNDCKTATFDHKLFGNWVVYFKDTHFPVKYSRPYPISRIVSYFAQGGLDHE